MVHSIHNYTAYTYPFHNKKKYCMKSSHNLRLLPVQTYEDSFRKTFSIDKKIAYTDCSLHVHFVYIIFQKIPLYKAT